MSEINGPKISVNQMSFNGIQKYSVSEESKEIHQEEQAEQLKDFSNSKAEALGRSILFKGVDNVNNDLKALLDNPQIAENSDEIFEKAYQTALESGAENPYEEAASVSTVSM